MTLFYIACILILQLIIIGNVVVFHLIIKNAVEKYVKPLLEENSLYYINYKWPGFFSCGDFKNCDIGFTTLAKTGPNSLSVYSFIYYKDIKSDLAKRVTIRIDVVGISTEKVVYSAAV